MKRPFVTVLLFILIALPAAAQLNDPAPRVGLVISKASFEASWEVVQMSAHGWAGVVNLAGVPYGCLFVEDVAGGADLNQYDALVLTQCTHLSDALYDGLRRALRDYTAAGGSVVIDGPLGHWRAADAERPERPIYADLGISWRGERGDDLSRIAVADPLHYVSRPWSSGEFLTQYLAGGLNVLEGGAESAALLEIVHADGSRDPFLTVRGETGSRLMLVGDFGTWGSAPSIFRNFGPQGAFDNQLYNVLLRAVHWLVYGTPQGAFPTPQLSNADLTAIVRLDADISGNREAQIETIHYLLDVARKTGVVPVYGWVSSGAAEAGWDTLAPLGAMIEALGGEVGTHSRFHRIDDKMTPARWRGELDTAQMEIGGALAEHGHPVGPIDWLINPGNTIRMSDYGEIAERFSFYMTHGFEQDVPIGYGNLTWYAEDHPDFVVIENIPAPDYQWFYDPEWSFTTQQISMYEEAVVDHLYRNVRRGVLFNEMWHDYSITSWQPSRERDRIMNANNRPFYDGLAAQFAALDIYAPTPEDLANKLRLMAQWRYIWTRDGDGIDLELDLSPVHLDTLAPFAGGMGIGIENAAQSIRAVTVNGKPHPAFREETVILPGLNPGTNAIRIELGETDPAVPRLTYVSKRLSAVSKGDDGIRATVHTRSLARLRFHSPAPAILVGADRQIREGDGGHSLLGAVTSDREVRLAPLPDGAPFIDRMPVTVSALAMEATSVRLTLRDRESDDRRVLLRVPADGLTVRLGDAKLTPTPTGSGCAVVLPAFTGEAVLTIAWQ